MIKVSKFSSIFVAVGLMASSLAFASGSSSANLLKADIVIKSVQSSYVPTPQADPATGTVVYNVVSTKSDVNVTATFKGSSNTETQQASSGPKTGTEFDRITVSKFDDKSVTLHFESRTDSDQFSSPVVQDVSVLGQLSNGTWNDYVQGAEVQVAFDSRAQAKLQRAFENTFSWAMKDALQKQFPGSKMVSSDATLDSQSAVLSRKELKTASSGTVSFSMDIPDTNIVK